MEKILYSGRMSVHNFYERHQNMSSLVRDYGDMIVSWEITDDLKHQISILADGFEIGTQFDTFVEVLTAYRKSSGPFKEALDRLLKNDIKQILSQVA